MEINDSNLDIVTEQIFGTKPLPRNTIQLKLSEKITDQIINKNIEYEYIKELLFVLTMKGIKMLFGHENILSLNEKQFNLLQEYVNSYEHHITYKITENHLDVILQKIY